MFVVTFLLALKNCTKCKHFPSRYYVLYFHFHQLQYCFVPIRSWTKLPCQISRNQSHLCIFLINRFLHLKVISKRYKMCSWCDETFLAQYFQAPYSQPDFWLLMIVCLGGYRSPTPKSYSHAQWFPSLWTPYQALVRQTFCNRCWCETRCYVLAMTFDTHFFDTRIQALVL